MSIGAETQSVPKVPPSLVHTHLLEGLLEASSHHACPSTLTCVSPEPRSR